MNSLCVVLMLMWFSNGLVTSSAIPINVEAGISLKIEGAHLDMLKSKTNATILLQMALELSSGDLRTPALIENIEDTPTPQPTTTTTTTMSPSTPKVCPSDFVELGERCYYFSTTKMAWQDALRSCMNLDADLVHPMSAVENSLITTYLKDNYNEMPRWWIGGTDQYDEGRWVWAHDKSPIGYNDWYESTAPQFKNDDCAYYAQPLGYKWYDNVCENEYRFICQQRSLGNDF